MLIRSQDKKRLYILDNAKGIFINDSNDICIDISFLGTYSSEAKAIKVLDMIQTLFTDTYSDGNTFCFDFPKLFQMPQDSEVEE